MAYRKKTLRSMSPTTRKVARLIGELDSVTRRLKNLIPDIQRLEADSQALYKRQIRTARTISEGDEGFVTRSLFDELEGSRESGNTK